MKNLNKNMGNIIFVGCAIIVLLIILGANALINQKNKEKEQANLLSGKHYVEMIVKDYGTIQLELDADIAPITVTNFVNLVNDKFYDGLTFHRIIDGFMIQGGDLLGNGTGGSEETIKGEFSLNGVENSISHVRGVISMARSNNSYNSASSQFFIVQEDSTSLDGQYAAFGHVISGMEVVDEIAKVEVEDDNGTVLAENQPVIESVRVISENEATSES